MEDAYYNVWHEVHLSKLTVLIVICNNGTSSKGKNYHLFFATHLYDRLAVGHR